MVSRVILQTEFDGILDSYSYLVPSRLRERLKKGMRVLVPFSNSERLLVGFVFDISQEQELNQTLKEIIDIVDEEINAETEYLLNTLQNDYLMSGYSLYKSIFPSSEFFRLSIEIVFPNKKIPKYKVLKSEEKLLKKLEPFVELGLMRFQYTVKKNRKLSLPESINNHQYNEILIRTGMFFNQERISLIKSVIKDNKQVIISFPTIFQLKKHYNEIIQIDDCVGIIDSESSYKKEEAILSGCNIILGVEKVSTLYYRRAGLFISISNELSHDYYVYKDLLFSLKSKYYGVPFYKLSSFPYIPDYIIHNNNNTYYEEKVINYPKIKVISTDSLLKVEDLDSVLFRVINEHLIRNRRVIIANNMIKRGNVIICKDCHRLYRCPVCNEPLKLDYETSMGICQNCLYKESILPMIKPTSFGVCKSCGGSLQVKNLNLKSMFHVLLKMFPNCSIKVVDSTMNHENFYMDKDYDILLTNTNVLSSGFIFTVDDVIIYDYDAISLSGKNLEHTYYQLSNVINNMKAGSDITILSRKPEDFCLNALSMNDYMVFSSAATKHRKAENLTPFMKNILITIGGKRIYKTYQYASYIRSLMQQDHLITTEIVKESSKREFSFIIKTMDVLDLNGYFVGTRQEYTYRRKLLMED